MVVVVTTGAVDGRSVGGRTVVCEEVKNSQVVCLGWRAGWLVVEYTAGVAPRTVPGDFWSDGACCRDVVGRRVEPRKETALRAMSDRESLDDQPQRYGNPGGMDAGGTDFDPGQQGQQGEQELATKMLQIQSKRFYLDVKQNRRGRFIKVAEIGADGRRSQIYLALSTASEFRNYLSTFSDFYASLGPPSSENVPDDGKLKSEVITKDNRRYYLDLKENTRGRFLRVSQTITRGGPRTQIAIPAQGMIEFRDALTDLLEEYGTDDGGFKGDLPEGRYMRVDSKNFYFDIGQNNRGIYMRISEVKTHFRTAITVPEKSWARFRDIFADYCDRMRERGAGSNVGMNSGGGGSVLPEGRGSVVAQVPSPSTSQQPNPNPNLDSPLMK